jgi:hypothetical protein
MNIYLADVANHTQDALVLIQKFFVRTRKRNDGGVKDKLTEPFAKGLAVAEHPCKERRYDFDIQQGLIDVKHKNSRSSRWFMATF